MSGAICTPFICLHDMQWDNFTLLIVIMNSEEEGKE